MDEIETNVSNLNKTVVSESADIFIPYSESGDILDYIKDQSKNFKIISEQFEMDQDNMTLSEDFSMVYAKQHSGDTIAIKTEDVIYKELNNYYKNMF